MVTLEITGIEDELQESALAAVQLAEYADRDVSPAEIRLLHADAESQIRMALRPLGYYEPMIDGELVETSPGVFVARYAVDPGQPVRVSSVNAEVTEPASALPEVRAAIEQFAPQPGEQFVDQEYERSKAAVDEALRNSGFLDARMVRREVAVTLATRSAAIDAAWEAGTRYRFGPMSISESQFPESLIRRYVPWQEGDPYSAEALLGLQQRLADADYFSVVSVRPAIDQASDAAVPIDVVLVPDERTIYTAGLHASTDTGAGGRVGIERRWINRRGHKAEGHLEYSQRLQEAALSYRMPRPGPFKREYAFGVAYRDEDTDSSRSQMTSVAAADSRERWKGFNRTLGLQYLRGDFEIADEKRSSEIIYAEAVLARKVADDALFTGRGYSVTFSLRATPGTLLSDTNLVQGRAQGKWIRSPGSDQRIIVRSELGALTADDFDSLPPRLRFFAGGDRSIRGFDYQAIGEQNATGGIIGGKYIAVASVEYERFFLPAWGAAVFADAGDAFNSGFETHVGAGIGLRWKSPVGLVRVDVAKPVRGGPDDGVRFHLTIGPDL